MASAAAVVAGELTTLDAFDAYRVRRGWAKQVPGKTEARADIPRQYATLERGQVTVAGAAWAPTRGVAAVEVGVDEGPGATAELAGGLGAEAGASGAGGGRRLPAITWSRSAPPTAPASHNHAPTTVRSPTAPPASTPRLSPCAESCPRRRAAGAAATRCSTLASRAILL